MGILHLEGVLGEFASLLMDHVQPNPKGGTDDCDRSSDLDGLQQENNSLEKSKDEHRIAALEATNSELRQNIQNYQAIEIGLRVSEQRFRALIENATDIIVILDLQGIFQYSSPSAERILGYTLADVVGRPALDFVHPDDQALIMQVLGQAVQQPGISQPLIEYRVRDKFGCWHFFEAITTNLLENSAVKGIVVNCRDITDRKQVEQALKLQIDRERILLRISQRIRQSLDLQEILSTTVSEVQQLLCCDRVIIFRFNENWQGTVLTESVAPGWRPILGANIVDPCFSKAYIRPYRAGRVRAIEDIENSDISPCHIELLAQFQVRANLVVPILQGEQLWGLLIAHHCVSPRSWQPWEIDLLKQLATSLEIALQQSQLYQQIRQFNAELEQQVQQRTAELEQALHFEALLKRITDKVRDSLDENQILQTAVDELGRGLGVLCCDVALYNAELTKTRICHEYNVALLPKQGEEFSIEGDNDILIHQQLFQGDYCQFCPLVSDSGRPDLHLYAILACPLFDDQGILGDMWLFRSRESGFGDQEVRLVQQVANQGAIAVRQARLYQAAQSQVEELERLNHLKDDFLSTVSHELRTPIASIKLATHMLQAVLQDLGLLEAGQKAAQYLQILNHECQREINLIDDLLDLSRLEADVEPLAQMQLDLQAWIPAISEVFEERMQRQNQHLELMIAENLPSITTDLNSLERILVELINNACKYTPAGETIRISATVVSSPVTIEGIPPYDSTPLSLNRQMPPGLHLCVCNTGIQLPAAELERIFDKFYRIPNSDPWKHGGTGLGLALVKKLAERLGGTIVATSADQATCFTLILPLQG